jgi:hypothetical protein
MVGTAPARVGRSSAIIRARGSACRKRPGRTKSVPAIQPAYGSPQALAWNIGTTGSTLSCSVSPSTLPLVFATECSHVDRWL